MKTIRSIGLGACLGFCLLVPARVAATNVGTGLVYQLAYLGDASQPDRIPLAPAIARSNYGYGTYGLISESRPCYHGNFMADGQPGYEQNLAVLFGISFDFSDPTQMPGSTLTIRLKPCIPPSNAPYSQEQVMAAAIQTTLSSAYGLSKARPLTVAIEGDGMPVPDWAAKYAKPYFPEDSDKEDSPILVPGVRMETSAMGVRSIVFTGVASNPAIKRRDPVFIPFTHEGESDNEGIRLVPVWHGDAWSEPMNVIVTPNLPYYERWSGHREGSESVAVPHMAPPNPVLGKWNLHIERTDTGTLIAPRYHDFSPVQLAALIHASITTIQPTEDRPLTISLADSTVAEEYQEVLRKHAAWNEGISCEFVLEPSTLKLVKGAVPEFTMEYRHGQLLVVVDAMRRMNESDVPVPDWIQPAIQYIRDEAPIATEQDLVAAKLKPESLLRDTDPASALDDEQRIRSLLALLRFDTSADTLKLVWRDSPDRKTRAIAASLVQTKHFRLTGSHQMNPSIERECDNFDEWQKYRRLEEIHHRTREAIQSAVAEWEKRQPARQD